MLGSVRHGCCISPPSSSALHLAVYAVRQPRMYHYTLAVRGIIFLPFTSLMYVLVYNPLVEVTRWGWFWMILGVVLDISSYASSAYSKRNRMPGFSGTWE